MDNEIQNVEVKPVRESPGIYQRGYQRVRRLPQQFYHKVEPYFPENAKEGKGMGYVIAGTGVAVALGLIGYGIYSSISSTSQIAQNCQAKYNKEVNLWNEYNLKFLNENVANNVPYSSAQNTYLQNIVNQENLIAQTCFKDNWVANAASIISEAFAAAILLYFGAAAYSLIKKKGYLKPPKTGSGGNADTPAGSTARARMGIIDYLRSSGAIPPSWDTNGTLSVNNIVSTAKQQVQSFTSQMVQLNLMEVAVASEIVAAETVAIEESSLLVLAVLA